MATEEYPVALITAGSAGLGAATARLFAKRGVRVAVNYSNNEERAATLVKELATLSPQLGTGGFMSIKADLGNRHDINQLVKETVDHFGRLDFVFSNGGWTKSRDINNLDDNMDEDDWDRCFNMNVKSHLFLMHASRPHLDSSGGAFITTASMAGLTVSGSSLVKIAQLSAHLGPCKLRIYVHRHTVLQKLPRFIWQRV